jgi:hypothetical protein
MNTKQINGGSKKTTFTSACLNACKEVLARINHARAAILTEARDTLNVQEQVIQLALNEAEARAQQTLYPHLLFPALATEKVRSVAQWNNRQRLLAR